MKKVLTIVALLSVLGFLATCESIGPQIENLTAENSQVRPGESTVLHCYVDNADEMELTYAWVTDTGRTENMGDSALWIAPDDFTWTSYSATITVTVGDPGGNTAEETIDLEVSVTRNDLTATDDTYTFEHDPDTNYADVIEMMVGHSDNYPGEFFRGFLKFATPAIAEGESLQGARIHLTREWGMGEKCQLAIELITEDWQGASVTWNATPTSTEWVTIDDNSSDKGAFYIGLDTTMVSGWIEGTRDNYGFMLRLNDETGSDEAFRSYVTVEDADENERPVLEVVSW